MPHVPFFLGSGVPRSLSHQAFPAKLSSDPDIVTDIFVSLCCSFPLPFVKCVPQGTKSEFSSVPGLAPVSHLFWRDSSAFGGSDSFSALLEIAWPHLKSTVGSRHQGHALGAGQLYMILWFAWILLACIGNSGCDAPSSCCLPEFSLPDSSLQDSRSTFSVVRNGMIALCGLCGA